MQNKNDNLLKKWHILVDKMNSAIENKKFNNLIAISNIKRILKNCDEEVFVIIKNESINMGGFIKSAFEKSLNDTNTK